ncbi:hypothetical protein ACFQ6U_13590 [Streptomyces sp. NPDC056465]|uniref:hypothetical protein n=1 Tax=Streptomyces sp. NPDC056465 TaxID=3345829 RepID=UPI00368C1E56
MPGPTTPMRERRSRKPTGRPNPPIVLLAGPEMTGKGHEAAVGTASDLVATTYWVQVGGISGTADYYGQIDGARYEIVDHDGSFDDILDALRWAISQPPAEDGRRNMVVIDDVSSVWDLLGDEVAHISRKRAERRAQSNGQRTARLDDPYVDEERDLWGHAKDRWGEMLWLLRRHNGPTLLIARQEIITAYESDKPTRHHTRRIKAEKNIRAAVDAVVEFHAVGEAYVTGMHAMPTHFKIQPGWTYRYEGVDTLLRQLGYEDAAESRAVTEARPCAYLGERPLIAQPSSPQQQQQAPAAQAPQHPALTDDDAAALIRKALEDEHNPESCLRAIREEWGSRNLQGLVINTPWGRMNADAAITRSLQTTKELAKKKLKEDAGDGQPKIPVPENGIAPTHQAEQDQAQQHHEDQADESQETEEPPPPDPEADTPPPPGETPEDTSAAEEPQDIPTAAAAKPRPSAADRKKAIATKALNEEADVQARLLMLTKSEHLKSISEDGDPPMTRLRDYLVKQRPALIAQLEAEGHTELAAEYRKAPAVQTQIRRMFEPYFNSVPSGS